MDLNGLAVFVETIKTGSITKAAASLNKPKSTLSRQLTEFENQLGVKLLERTTRKLDLTEAGKELFDNAYTYIEELKEIQLSVGAYQRHPKGRLTFLWPQELFTGQMAELISEFLQNWPEISFCGTQYNGAAPSPSADYDLQFMLHQGELPASDWIARPLMSIPHSLYIAAHCKQKAPKSPQELSSCSCILQSGEDSWAFREGTQTTRVPVSGRLTLNSTDMRLQATIRGLGVVRLPNYIADPHVKSGALVEVLFRQDNKTSQKPVADQLSVMYRSRQLPLKTRLFLEHFQNHIGRLYSQI